MNFKKFLVVGLLFAVFGTVSSFAQSRDKAPNFSLKTGDGKVVELAKLKGRVVVLNFWATWCGPCRKEIPGFLEAYEKYRSKGLEIVGISLDQSGWDVVKPFVEKARITYPVVVGDGKLANAYGGIQAIPTTVIVDREGNIASRHVGYFTPVAFERLIKEML